MKSGLVLFAHGARDPRWAAPFDDVAARVRAARPQALVRLAFLELMAPDLAAATDELIALGCASIQVLPLFLGTGGHLRRDLPAVMAHLRERHPSVAFDLHAAAGEHSRVIDAMASVAIELLAR